MFLRVVALNRESGNVVSLADGYRVGGCDVVFGYKGLAGEVLVESDGFYAFVGVEVGLFQVNIVVDVFVPVADCRVHVVGNHLSFEREGGNFGGVDGNYVNG